MLPFLELFNFRDVGGYVGLNGRRVRWRRLFRSDSLHRLGPADQATFADLGVRTVIDLRRPSEVALTGRVPGFVDGGYRNMPPKHAEWDIVEGYERLNGTDAVGWLTDRYLELARDGRADLAAVVGVIADRDAAPLVVHCAAGKDRTGIVCALTLSLLGVADTDIAADYALSVHGVRRFADWLRQTNPSFVFDPSRSYAASPAETMLRFLETLRERYGSIERYLVDGGLADHQVTALRAHLLEDGQPEL